ncbi:MAG TPA: DUF2252 domain-containing protein [Anaeromyxobacteraceae bacterium]|nr:DUF2252 domain-containing protein [Anaeromyxobacteraceae bacterium]
MANAARPSRAERRAMGKSLRERCPRKSHAAWKPPANRADPVRLVEVGDAGRIPELVPLRHGRMLRSPFTFYRGAALHMAADLATTPATGLRVQACGDAHLVNFRVFATSERRAIFDIHDLDETLPAPWEWDLKRLAASFVVASRNNGIGEGRARDAALACARSYREHMAQYAGMHVLDVWYASIVAEELLRSLEDAETRARAQRRLGDELARSAAEHDFPRLAQVRNGVPLIKDTPPTIYHLRRMEETFHDAFHRYEKTLTPARRSVLDRFDLRDVAIKVVGVGSVGTVCAVILLMAGDGDPLFLQAKEARASVLEAYAGRSAFRNHGQRVVNGHHLVQSASDMFLGWTDGARGRHFYFRQLRDVKIKFAVETFGSAHMLGFGEWCGHTLARAHARSGDPVAIAGYLGGSDVFDEAIADFSVAYADQTERDHETLKKAARSKKLEVLVERA